MNSTDTKPTEKHGHEPKPAHAQPTKVQSNDSKIASENKPNTNIRKEAPESKRP
jgi:hypothetical protein